jgi:glycosyltransferase involved in cell wall biosynthesis
MKIISVTLLGNNEGTVGDALRSVIDYVDTCVIINTGITDRSLEIAREIGGDKIQVIDYEWRNDFSHARNFALNSAYEATGGDWAISIDSDEQLFFRDIKTKQELQITLERYAAHEHHANLVLSVKYSDGHYSKERMFRLPLKGGYEGPTHECYCNGYLELFREAYFTEYGKTPEGAQKKFLRDIDILEKYTGLLEQVGNPDPRWYFYLGESYKNAGMPEKAVGAYHRCWEMNGWDEEGAWACYKQAVCYADMGKYQEGLEAICRGLARNPVGDLLWYAGWLCYRMGLYKKAIYWSQLSLQAGWLEGYGAGMRRGGFSHTRGLYEGPYDVLHWCYKELGDTANAERYRKLCLRGISFRENINTTKDLIIIPVGDDSLHETWVGGVEADVCINYYGDIRDKYKSNNTKYYYNYKGSKWEIIHRILDDIDITKYRYIWFPDDDIRIGGEDVNKFFRYMSENNIGLGQPSLTVDSYHSYSMTLNKGDTGHRLTNFVEILAPCYKSVYVNRLKRFFLESGASTGWGLDFLCSQYVLAEGERVAVIDEVQMCHTRPVGNSYDMGVARERMFRFLDRYCVDTYRGEF